MTRNKKQGTVRRVAATTADVVVGGTALAADKARETIDTLAERGEAGFEHAARAARDRATGATDAARQALEKVSGASATVRHVLGDEDRRPYEERTRDELYQLASERGIEGRSTMRKAEIIEALRAER